MPDPAILLYVFDGFADWEPSYAVAELRRSGGFEVRTVADGREPVRSMGGVRVLPDLTVAEVEPGRVRLLILPGGDRWEREPAPPALLALLCALDQARVPVAAICAATTVIARAGLLGGRRHTSNGLDYLRAQVPDYAAAGAYVDEPAVRDRHLITASGLGAVEFAREIFEELEVLGEEDRALWYRLFRG
jgi:putative intracellular protease/amidase